MAIDINESRKRAEAAIELSKEASPGPWISTETGERLIPTVVEEHGGGIAIVGDPDSGIWICEDGCCAEYKYEHYGNARFIAHARTDVPQLAQDLLEALEEIERLREMISNYQDSAYERK